MGGLALLFPGQASQSVGMGVELRRASARARAIFDLADAITGLPITRLCEEGPLDRLTATDVAQPAVVATSLAALAVLGEQCGTSLQPGAVAGHSVGEFAACVAAGVMDEATALRLVHVRAQAMAAACSLTDGTMAAVLGADPQQLRAACEEASGADGSVEIANLNAPDQTVIAGARPAVERAAELIRAAGARRVIPLTVGGPFHSVYMRPAAAALTAAVCDVTLQPAAVPLVGNVSAAAIRAPTQLADELSRQVYSPVRWVESLLCLAAMGCDRFLEVGPGQVLVGLVKRTLPGARAANLGAMADLDGAVGLVRAE